MEQNTKQTEVWIARAHEIGSQAEDDWQAAGWTEDEARAALLAHMYEYCSTAQEIEDIQSDISEGGIVIEVSRFELPPK